MTYQKTDLSGTPQRNPGPKLNIDAESKALAALAAGIAKAVLYICLTVVLCFYVSSCQLDADTVKQCEASCNTSGNRMKSVSNTSCECISRDSQESGLNSDIWVIPRDASGSGIVPVPQANPDTP